MATLEKHKWLCYLLTISFLCGSCHVYQKIPVTLEEATVSNQRIKITRVDNKKRFFKRVEKTDSIYYGLEESGLDIIKKELKREEIQQIQIINKPKSRLLTIAGVTVSIGLLVALITSSGWSTGAGPVGGF